MRPLPKLRILSLAAAGLLAAAVLNALAWGAHDPAPAVVVADPPVVVEVARPPAPKWQVLAADPGQVKRLALKDGESAVWVLAGEGTADLTPQDTLTPSVDFVGPRGRHYLVAYVAGKPVARVVVVVGDAPPGKDPPPGTDPPPPEAGTLFFVVVREDGPATPGFTGVMGDPAWKTLTDAGHRYKDYGRTDATAKGFIRSADNAQLPCVVTLRVSADGRSSTRVRGPIPLPTTGTGILDLPKGVTP